MTTILPDREALAATSRVLVLDEETAGDRLCPLAIVNDFGRVVCGVHYEKDADATFWDRSQPLGAPHRVVRVALVDADDMGERGVAITDAMVERAAEALYDLHEDWEVNRLGKPTSASKSWVHADGETRSVRYQQARIALTAALEVPRGE